MRTWFGPSAGRPGTAWTVRFRRSPDGWWVEPMGQVVELPRAGTVVAYPTLRAAAGAVAAGAVEAPGAEEVLATGPSDGELTSSPCARRGPRWMAASRRSGTVTGWCSGSSRGVGIGAMKDQVVLVQVPGGQDASAWQLKRIVHRGRQWELRSDNPAVPAHSGDGRDDTDRADGGPHLSRVSRPAGGRAPRRGRRGEGHSGPRVLPARAAATGTSSSSSTGAGNSSHPTGSRSRSADRRPGETAFVLAQIGRGSLALLRRGAVERGSRMSGSFRRSITRPGACSERGGSARGALPRKPWEPARSWTLRSPGRVHPGRLVLGGKKRARSSVARRVEVCGSTEGRGDSRPRSVSLTDLGWVLLRAG